MHFMLSGTIIGSVLGHLNILLLLASLPITSARGVTVIAYSPGPSEK